MQKLVNRFEQYSSLIHLEKIQCKTRISSLNCFCHLTDAMNKRTLKLVDFWPSVSLSESTPHDQADQIDISLRKL